MDRSSSLYEIKWKSYRVADRPATETDRPLEEPSGDWQSIYKLRDEISRKREYLKAQESTAPKTSRGNRLKWQNKELQEIVNQLKRDK